MIEAVSTFYESILQRQRLWAPLAPKYKRPVIDNAPEETYTTEEIADGEDVATSEPDRARDDSPVEAHKLRPHHVGERSSGGCTLQPAINLPVDDAPLRLANDVFVIVVLADPHIVDELPGGRDPRNMHPAFLQFLVEHRRRHLRTDSILEDVQTACLRLGKGEVRHSRPVQLLVPGVLDREAR